MMNNHNGIGKDSALFGFIGEEANQNRISVSINRVFKQHGDDAMMIPMNIRVDDFYFTLSNMRQAQLKGAAISSEFQKDSFEICDELTDISSKSGLCDFVLVREQKLYGDFIAADILVDYIQSNKLTKIALIGSSALAKAFAIKAKELDVAFYDERVEALMQMMQELEFEIDINRLMQNQDFSQYELVIDFSDMDSLSLVNSLAGENIDFKTSKQMSALRQRAKELDANYRGYDELVESMSNNIYKYLKQERVI